MNKKPIFVFLVIISQIASYGQLAKVTLRSGSSYPVTLLVFTKDSVLTNIVPTIITNHHKNQIKKIIYSDGKTLDKNSIISLISNEKELNDAFNILDSLERKNNININASSAKKVPPYIDGDTLVTSFGYRIRKNDVIKIGSGSTNDGDFKYIRINANSLFRYYSNRGYNNLANSANAFPRGESGLNYTVNELSMRGDNEHGYVYYAKIKLRNTLVNYEIDVENALISNELVLPEQFRKVKNDVTKQVIISQQPISVADELIKLKKLLDDGVLTKEEFESQKKKVLGNN